MKVLIAFLIATIVFLGLKIIRMVLKRLLNRYSGLNFIDNLLLALELIIWLAFIFWTTNFLFSEKFFYRNLVYVIILIVVAFLSWFMLRDIFAGIIFRVRHNLKTGSYIKAGDFSGQIKSQALSYLKIKTNDNQLLRVPYSILIHKAITEMTYPEDLEAHLIHLHVDISVGKVSAAESFIRSSVMNSPWSSLKEEPAIKFLKETENGYFFDIKLLSVTMKQMKYIQMALEEIPSLHVIV